MPTAATTLCNHPPPPSRAPQPHADGISTIQALCITAYERQMKALEAAEGPDVRLMQELKSELKEVKAVNVDKADKEGKKFLTAF